MSTRARLASPKPFPAALPVLLAVLAVLTVAGAAGAAGDDGRTAPEGATAAVYRSPGGVLEAIVDAPMTPTLAPAPGDAWGVLMHSPSLPPVAELAVRELRLAGLRIDPAVSGPSRNWTLNDLTFLRLADGAQRPVTGLPAAPRLDDVAWSPDGSRLAFTHTADDRVELWVAEVASGEARRLTDQPLNLVARGAEPRWLPDGSGLLVALVPADRGAEPPAPRVPAGPVIQENLGSRAPARTYQDLLQNRHDEALFAHYMTATLARVGLDGGVTRLGEPAMIWSFDPSPDGRFVLVESIQRPFSYLVPVYRFPRRVEVRDATTGEPVHLLADLPLQEEISIAFNSVPDGPRDHAWRHDAAATVVWVEALDGGDANREAEERDRLFQLAAPFDGEPRALATFGLRFGGVAWGGGDLALATTWWWRDRTTRVWRLAPDVAERAPELLLERSFEDRYSDPGEAVTVHNAAGRPVLLRDGETLFLIGDGASEQGDRPFLDRWNLASGEKERLFRSRAPHYERPVTVLDAGSGRVLTRRESVSEPPDYFVRTLADAGTDAEPQRLTSFPHPTPQLEGLHKELVRYRRDDGVELTATLYLPPGHDVEEDGPLPTLLWAYPQEFKSADAAGQVTDSPYRFDRVGWWSPLLWLTQGYAVLDDPTMPIVGEGDAEPNDRYVEQLVASAAAAVDEVVRRGVAEPGRVAIGGHSYGAFMAANLLAHSDLFAAGVARSGAYNRTLTPFGFQAEERTLWEAPEVYFRMSPFMHADRVDEPLLLVHGEADNNSGTYPMQSERFYAALKGHGATVRLVMLPHESHGYRARESVLHMLWETGRWLDRYVKAAPAERPEVAEPEETPEQTGR